MSNSTDKICVLLLTPTYSTLPRLNTTVLLLFILVSPTTTWATKGALAALMVRVATIVTHAIVLLATKNTSHPFNLDIIGAWFILSETAVSISILLCWAPALRKSKARVLVRIWGVMVHIGAICSFATVRWAQKHVDDRTCTQADPLNDHGAWASTTKNNVFARLAGGALLGKFDVAAVAAASFGVWTCVRPELWSRHDSKSISRRAVRIMEICGTVFASVVLVAILVLHEHYMLREPKLPMLLPIVEYEQWSCWAATGLIGAATLFNWMFARREQPPKQTFVTLGPRDSWQDETARKLEWGDILGRPAPSYIS